MLQVLNRRFETLDGDYVVLSERASRPSREPRPAPSFFETLRTQGRVIHALIIRETRTRFGDSKLGYGWALLEPIAHILMLSLVFAVMMRGRPPIGDEFFIFYYTGIIPYHMFVRGVPGASHLVPRSDGLTSLFAGPNVPYPAPSHVVLSSSVAISIPAFVRGSITEAIMPETSRRWT